MDTQSRVPKTCPECERSFTVREKTNIKFQRKYIILFALSACIPGLAMLILSEIFPDLDRFSATIGKLIYVPTILIAIFCYSRPKVLKLRCAKCKYTEDIFMDKVK